MNEFVREIAEKNTYVDLLKTARRLDIHEHDLAKRVAFCYQMDLITFEMVEKIAEVFVQVHPESHAT